MPQAAYVHSAILILGCPILVAIGVWSSRGLIRRLNTGRHHDVIAAIINVIGVVYAVLLAFVLFAVWGQYDQIRAHVQQEAAQMLDIVRLSEGAPRATRQGIHDGVIEYGLAVVDDEWPAMQLRGSSARAEKALDGLWRQVVGIEPESPRESILCQSLLERLGDLSDSRRMRLSLSEPSVQPLLWLLLLIGAAITVIAAHLFDLPIHTHIIITAALTILIALTLLLVFAFDHPIDGEVGIAPEPIRAALASIDQGGTN